MVAEAYLVAQITEWFLSYYGAVNTSLEITRIFEKFISGRDAAKLTKAFEKYAKGEFGEDELSLMIEDVSPDVWNKISESVVNILAKSKDAERPVWMRFLTLAMINNEINDVVFTVLLRAFRELPIHILKEARVNHVFDKTRNELLASYGIVDRKFESGRISYSNHSPVYQAFYAIREKVISEMNAVKRVKDLGL